LKGEDIDGDTLTYSVQLPSHGTLTGNAPQLTYVPFPGFSGTDSFVFQASDGMEVSLPAVISINVLAVNNPPVAIIKLVVPEPFLTNNTGWLFISGNQLGVTIVLDGSLSQDADGDPLRFKWLAETSAVSTSGILTNNYALGSHSAILSVSDGFEESNTSVAFSVITLAEAVAEIIRRIEASSLTEKHKHALLVMLWKAEASYRVGSLSAGDHYLQTFRTMLAAQLRKSHPALMVSWNNLAAAVLEAAANRLVGVPLKE
jgi:hypothetical protein